jgi:Flp pilus assembly pilin Flp
MAAYAVSRLLPDELGQDLVEYALLLAFVALVCIAAMEALGSGIASMYEDQTSAIEAADSSGDDTGNTAPGAPGAGKPGKGKGRGKKPKP